VYQRARVLAAHVGTLRQRMNVLYGVWGVHFARAEHLQSLDWAQEAHDVGATSDDVEAQILGTRLLGESRWALGDINEAVRLLDKAMTIAPDISDVTDLRLSQDHRVAAGTFLAWALAQAGQTERARAAARRARARSDQLGHPLTSALASLCGSYLAMLLGEVDEAEQAGRLAAQFCEAQGVSNFAAWARFSQEWGAFWRADGARDTLGMRHAIAEADRLSAVLFKPLNLALLGEAESAMGRIEAGRIALDEALQLTEATGERAAQAEVLRQSARNWMLLGETERAHEEITQGLAAARKAGVMLYWNRLHTLAEPCAPARLQPIGG
jgi:tetratricopeptide (TPR) repeat protein